MEIRENELCTINGGAIKIAGWLIGGGIFTLVVGIIDGLIKLKWQNHKNIVFIRNLKGKPLIQIRRKGSIMFIKLLDLMLT